MILGGINAAGTLIDPAGANFTLPFAVVARITIDLVHAGDMSDGM